MRIASLTVNTFILERLNFLNCRIVGPAVLVPLGETQILHCGFDASGVEAVYWEIPPSRTEIVGAVGLQDCTFSNCTFVLIGLAGPPEMRSMLEAGFSDP